MKRLIGRLFLGKHSCQLTHLQLKDPAVGCLPLQAGHEDRFSQPRIIACNKACQSRFGQPQAMVCGVKIIVFDFTPIEHGQHNRIDDNSAPFFDEIRRQGGVAVLVLMEKALVGIEPDDVKRDRRLERVRITDFRR